MAATSSLLDLGRPRKPASQAARGAIESGFDETLIAELAIPSYNTVKIHIAKHHAAGDQNASWDTWKRAAVKQASR